MELNKTEIKKNKEYNTLNINEKKIFSNGFKLAIYLVKTGNTNKIQEYLNKFNNINNTSNEKFNNNLNLIKSIEDMIKDYPEKKKEIVIISLKEYLYYDKKYKDNLNILKKLRNNIKENKVKNMNKDYIKYIKSANKYNELLGISFKTSPIVFHFGNKNSVLLYLKLQHTIYLSEFATRLVRGLVI